MIVKSLDPKNVIPETKTEARALYLISYLKNRVSEQEIDYLLTGSELKDLIYEIIEKIPNYESMEIKSVRKVKKDVISKANELFPNSVFIEKSKHGRNETSIRFTLNPEMIWDIEKKENQTTESDYPSLEDISYLFNPKVQKEKNSTIISYRNITIRRDLMIRILNKFSSKEFTYNEVKYECNDRDGEENFLRHWEYLLNNYYIEETTNNKFKFCDRVKRWKTFK
jgi:hypothetical protein